jgi:hypothetical protein
MKWITYLMRGKAPQPEKVKFEEECTQAAGKIPGYPHVLWRTKKTQAT